MAAPCIFLRVKAKRETVCLGAQGVLTSVACMHGKDHFEGVKVHHQRHLGAEEEHPLLGGGE